MQESVDRTEPRPPKKKRGQAKVARPPVEKSRARKVEKSKANPLAARACNFFDFSTLGASARATVRLWDPPSSKKGTPVEKSKSRLFLPNPKANPLGRARSRLFSTFRLFAFSTSAAATVRSQTPFSERKRRASRKVEKKSSQPAPKSKSRLFLPNPKGLALASLARDFSTFRLFDFSFRASDC